MKLRLRRHETRETLKLELPDTATLRDLRRRINASEPTAVHLSLNRMDELFATSPEDTLRSLGVASGDLIYFSLDHSAFISSVHEIGSVSWGEAHQALVPSGESSSPTLDPAKGSAEKNSGMEVPEPMDIEQRDVNLAAAAGSKRLSEPFFLKKVLLEKCGDTSELTTLAISVHAVMLEFGFVLFDHGSDKFSFSKELFSVSLSYTLPEIITPRNINAMESVTVMFQRLGGAVVAYGTLGGSNRTHRVSLDKNRFVPVIDLVMDTLKFEKQASSSYYREVFVLWRMVKDGLALPLMVDLCDKAGLELPLCFMRLPAELKLKIIESLPGESVAKMACVCTEMRYLASDDDLWKQKCLEETKYRAVNQSGGSVIWKEKFALYWRRKKIRQFCVERRNSLMRGSRIRFPRIMRDPSTWFNGDHTHGSIRFRAGQPGHGFGRRTWGQRFGPRCNLGGSN